MPQFPVLPTLALSAPGRAALARAALTLAALTPTSLTRTSLTPTSLSRTSLTLGVLTLGACAGVPSPEIVTVPAGEGALRCGALELEGLGYETRAVEPGVVEARSLRGGLPAHTDRHVVELRVEEGSELVATVSRWRYERSESAVPVRPNGVRPQTVVQARPEGAVVEAVRTALERCRGRG